MSWTLYTNPMSRGRIARWMCEEVREATGTDYETVLLDFGTTMKAPEFLGINPMGKVPALRHGASVVTEAAAICAYMADAFPAAGLAPDPTARGDYYRWLFFAAGPMEQAIVNRSLGVTVDAEHRGRTGYGSLEAVADALDGWLAAHAYVCGDAFTAADVYVGAAVSWGLAFETLPERPGFAPYVERTASRTAAVRAKKIDDALMERAEG